MKLADYRRKRDPARTNEPFGGDPPEEVSATTGGAFVIHQHDATRMHYDLRFEVGGVLASFAVPRGPSLDPTQRHLAVQTEDHPMEYLEFEEVIPDGQYGAGPMILWDRGRIRFLDGTAEQGLARGKVDFELEGHKVRGRYALVHIKGGKDSEWLLLKKNDAFASTTRDPVRDEPRSVLSGLTVVELKDAAGIAARLEERAAALGAPLGAVDARGTVPMLCAPTGAPTNDPGWLYELKLDGVRALAAKTEAGVALSGRKQHDTTATYPEVARAVKALAAPRLVLDGEIIALDAQGQPSFQRLGQRIHLARTRDIRRAMIDVPVVYLAFDLLALGGRDLRELPLVERKRLLHALLPAPGILRVLDHIEGDGRPLLTFCRAHHLEGIVAKRAASTYRAGPRRTGDWVKMKCERDEDFVVVGFTRGEGGRDRLGALDLATWDRGELVFRGKVGSGLDDASIDALLHRLSPLAADAPTARGEYVPAPRGRTHVRPELVVRVRFLGWSEDGQARHPVYAGLRDDALPAECTAGPPIALGDDDAPPAVPEAEAEPEPEARVAITNPTKVLFPDEGYTKADLARYYEAIAPAMLRYLADRPIMMVRYPDGIRGKHFYQWHVPPGVPAWLRTLRLRAEEDKDVVEVFLLENPGGLVYVANLAAIPIHVLASRARTLDQCDFLTLDFDVKGATLDHGVELALTLREILGALGLTGFPKTSGQSGLHVFVPLGPAVPYVTARALADLLGGLLVHRHPATATMERIIAKRGPKVYVDTGQTGRSRTIVAPFAVRAQAGATVSTPLRWSEVELGLDPRRFTIRTVPDRVRAEGDPMADLLTVRPDLPRAVAGLEAMVRKASLPSKT